MTDKQNWLRFASVRALPGRGLPAPLPGMEPRRSDHLKQMMHTDPVEAMRQFDARITAGGLIGRALASYAMTELLSGPDVPPQMLAAAVTLSTRPWWSGPLSKLVAGHPALPDEAAVALVEDVPVPLLSRWHLRVPADAPWLVLAERHHPVVAAWILAALTTAPLQRVPAAEVSRWLGAVRACPNPQLVVVIVLAAASTSWPRLRDDGPQALLDLALAGAQNTPA